MNISFALSFYSIGCSTFSVYTYILTPLGYEIRSDRDFDIIIENSGEISDETLQSLNEKLQSTDMQMETTAIININRRLKLYFGDKSGLLVGRSELGGLKVIVHVFMGEETS